MATSRTKTKPAEGRKTRATVSSSRLKKQSIGGNPKNKIRTKHLVTPDTPDTPDSPDTPDTPDTPNTLGKGIRARKKEGDRPSSFREQTYATRGVMDLKTPTSKSIASQLVKSGVSPDVGTVIYVHGVGNKPVASVLKCQWDTALFGGPMGDKTRLAYWVDRDRFPVAEGGTCGEGDLVTNDAALETLAKSVATAATGDELQKELELIGKTPQQRRILAKIGDRLIEAAESSPASLSATGVGAKILPLPGFLRRRITRFLTKLFLEDVND